ncbi:hypothetical protein ACHAXA_000490 [Cyclostephanos tholiformis]|uniref:Acylphosphatase-like domain-containing protein n=1 Tax=Cyclostephanos tholiformis TaxID=382380 RepID=A0ABD3STT0_9STRA
MMHCRPMIAALSLFVGLSSTQVEVALAFSIEPAVSPATSSSAAAVVDPRAWPRCSLSFWVFPIPSMRTTTMTTTTTTTVKTMTMRAATRCAMAMARRGARGGDDYYEALGVDPSEIIARRIVVTGDVNGGYYRSCVKNEASRFRKLIGNMSPPDEDTKRAEIYVEGKRKMVDGFVRWCKRGDVGLSQSIVVESVSEEFPTGMYDDFYVHTGR